MQPNFIQKQRQINSQVNAMIMKRSLHILTMPHLELKEFIKNELETNPLIDVTERKSCPKELSYAVEELDFEKDTLITMDAPQKEYFFTQDITIHYPKKEKNIAKKSFYEFLKEQLFDFFTNEQEKKIALQIIENLDEKGYFTVPCQDLAMILNLKEKQIASVLDTIKENFEPRGVAAKNLQECLLLQCGKKSLAEKIIQNHYPDLLNRRIKTIRKNLNIPLDDIKRCIFNEIGKMHFCPKSQFAELTNIPHFIEADVIVEKLDNKWTIEINENEIPSFKINKQYTEILKNSTDAENDRFFKEKIFAANLLRKNLLKRRKTLQAISLYILKKQLAFFHGSANIAFMTINEVAEDLHLHPSTIFRAIIDKHIDTPRGLLPLKIFFSTEHEKDRSKNKKDVIAILKEIISKENKETPFSDAQIAENLKKFGVSLKRRTIAKYRKKMSLSPSYLRKR